MESAVMADEPPADLMSIEAAVEVMAIAVPVEYAGAYTPVPLPEGDNPEEPTDEVLEEPTDETREEHDPITVDEPEGLVPLLELYRVYLPVVWSGHS